jgi:hypothetical protein
VRTVECAVLQRHRHLSVDEEHGTNSEFRAKGSRKPHSIRLPVINNIKVNPGKICSQQGADHEWHATRQPGEHQYGLKFLGIDIRLARPGDLVLVLRPEAYVVNAASLQRLLTEEFENVIFLLLTGQRKQVSGQTVFGIVVRQIVTEVLDQIAIKTVFLRRWLAGELLVPSLVPVAAGQQRKRPSTKWESNLTRPRK